MLYFQVVILAAAMMLVYYCEFTDTFSPAQQGFICKDPTLTKPDPGPEQDSRIQPVILYSVVGGLPVVLVSLDTFWQHLHSLDLNFTTNLPGINPHIQSVMFCYSVVIPPYRTHRFPLHINMVANATKTIKD